MFRYRGENGCVQPRVKERFSVGELGLSRHCVKQRTAKRGADGSLPLLKKFWLPLRELFYGRPSWQQ